MDARRFALVGVGLLTLGVAVGLLAQRSPRATLAARAAVPNTPPPLPPASARPASAPFSLGINEALAVPSRILDRGLAPGELDRLLADDAREARALGARAVRGHTGNFPRISQLSLSRDPGRLDEADAWVRAAQAEGLEPLLMVSPWPGNATFNYTDTYVPADLAAYEVYVGRLVERYDHDGVDDMPGLKAPVRYWEVDNEPDLKLNTAPKDGTKPFTPGVFCPPEDYAKVLVATARAARAAYPEVRILNGGPFRPHAETGADYVQKLFKIEGVAGAVDVLSLHTYPNDADGSTLERGIQAVRAVAPDKPVWLTETSVSLDADTDEVEQARMVALIAARSASLGVERVFWHTLADPPERPEAAGRPGRPAGPGGGFKTNSLLRTLPDQTRAEKPAGTVYRNLAAVLAERDLGRAVVVSPGLSRFPDGSSLLWSGEVTAPAGGRDLRTGLPIEQGMNASAPAWLAGP